MQNRFTSPVFLGTVGMFILFVMKTWGLFAPLGLTADSFNEGWAIILALVAIISAANNPTDKGNF